MSCTCNKSVNCEPCAFCTPPGVVCLPDCNPEDPCPEKIDLCCVEFSGQTQPCANIQNTESLCDLIETFFEQGVPTPVFCELEVSVDILPSPITTSSTTTTSTSTTSTSSSTTTTTAPPGYRHDLCYSVAYDIAMCPFICAHCTETNIYYSTCPDIIQSCILYTSSTLSPGTEAPGGYYSDGDSCIIVANSGGIVASVNPCPTPAPTKFTLSAYSTAINMYPSGGISSLVSVQGTPGDTVYLRSTFLSPNGIPGTTVINGISLPETTGASITYSIVLNSVGLGTIQCFSTISGNTTNKTGAKFVKNEILSTALQTQILVPISYTNVAIKLGNGEVCLGRSSAIDSTSVAACANYLPTNEYTVVGHSQVISAQVGDIVYVDYQNNVKFNGGNNWISLVPADVYPLTSPKMALQVASNGVVVATAICP